MISDRKLEHLLICENYDVEFKDKTTGFEDIELIHNVLPEIDKNDIDLYTDVFGKKLDSPLFITAITGGHPAAKEINKQLAIAAENNGIAMVFIYIFLLFCIAFRCICCIRCTCGL